MNGVGVCIRVAGAGVGASFPYLTLTLGSVVPRFSELVLYPTLTLLFLGSVSGSVVLPPTLAFFRSLMRLLSSVPAFLTCSFSQAQATCRSQSVQLLLYGTA